MTKKKVKLAASGANTGVQVLTANDEPLKASISGVNTSAGYFNSNASALTFVESAKSVAILLTTGEDVNTEQRFFQQSSNVIGVLTNGRIGAFYTISMGLAANPNTTYLVVVVYDPSQENPILSYVNGNYIGSGRGTVVDAKRTFSVGANSSGVSKFLGTIHSCRLFNYALTPEEVSALWNGGNPGEYMLSANKKWIGIPYTSDFSEDTDGWVPTSGNHGTTVTHGEDGTLELRSTTKEYNITKNTGITPEHLATYEYEIEIEPLDEEIGSVSIYVYTGGTPAFITNIASGTSTIKGIIDTSLDNTKITSVLYIYFTFNSVDVNRVIKVKSIKVKPAYCVAEYLPKNIVDKVWVEPDSSNLNLNGAGDFDFTYKVGDVDGYQRFSIPWDPSAAGDNLYIFMNPDMHSQVCLIGSDENTLTSIRKKTLTFKTNVLGLSSSAQAVAELNVTQEEANYTYDFSIASSVTGKLSAGGQNTTLSASLVTFRNGVQVSTQSVNASYSIPATPGFTLSGSTLTAANRTTVVGGDRSVEVTGEFTTSEGIKVTDVISVTQAANTATYENPVVGLDYPIIPASGGTVVPGNAAWSQVITYSSGASETKVGIGVGSYSGDGVDPKTGSVTAPSKGITVSGLTVITTSTLTVVANGKTGSYSRDVTQAANSAELDSIEVVPNTTQAVPASGGTRTFSIRATMKYTSGSTSTSIPTTSMEFSIPTTSWASISENTLTVNNRGTEIGSSRTVVVTVKYTWGGKSVTDTYTVSQQANAETLSSVYITGTASGYTKDTVPYTGGTVVWSVTGVYTYTSGADAEKPVDASEGNWTVTGTGATQNGATTTWAQNLSEGSRSATVKFTHSDSGEIATGITTQLSQNLVVASYSDILSVYSNVKAGY